MGFLICEHLLSHMRSWHVDMLGKCHAVSTEITQYWLKAKSLICSMSSKMTRSKNSQETLENTKIFKCPLKKWRQWREMEKAGDGRGGQGDGQNWEDLRTEWMKQQCPGLVQFCCPELMEIFSCPWSFITSFPVFVPLGLPASPSATPWFSVGDLVICLKEMSEHEQQLYRKILHWEVADNSSPFLHF